MSHSHAHRLSFPPSLVPPFHWLIHADQEINRHLHKRKDAAWLSLVATHTCRKPDEDISTAMHTYTCSAVPTIVSSNDKVTVT